MALCSTQPRPRPRPRHRPPPAAPAQAIPRLTQQGLLCGAVYRVASAQQLAAAGEAEAEQDDGRPPRLDAANVRVL